MSPVLVDICTVCRSRCRYCLHQWHRAAPRLIMPLGQFTRIADILIREGYNRIYTYMTGEPLLNPEFGLILGAAGWRGFVWCDTATKLNAHLQWYDVQESAKCWPQTRYHFLVGLDSLRQATLDVLSPGTDRQLVMRNLESLADVATRCPNVKINCCTIVTRHNAGELGEINDRCASLGLPWAVRDLGMPGRLIQQADVADLCALYPCGGTYRYRLDLDGTFHSRHDGKAKCEEPIEPAVNALGDVTLCCNDSLWQGVVGNMLEAGSMKAVLESELAQAMYAKCRHRAAPYCRGCS